jgi:O-antigen/teichoic acid export membrane protein
MEKLKLKLYQLLRWSEKYTKTDMVYLVKGGAWLTGGQIIATASSFLLAITFANLLPKETYGVYTYILSIVGILSIPTLSGMATAAVQAVARGYEGSLMPIVKTKIRWGLLGSIASLILAGYYYFLGNATLTISFLIVACFLPIMEAFGVYDNFLQGRKLFGVSVKFYIINQIIAVASLIAAVFFTRNLFIILLAYFVPWTLTRFIFFKIILKKFSPNQKQDLQTISYGKHLTLMGIIGTVASCLDQLLIFHYLGAAELAIYSFALAPAEQIKNLLNSMNTLALPKFSQRSKEEIKKTIMGKIFRYALLIAAIVIVYILAAPLIYKIFFPKYPDSVFYSQIFAVSLISGAALLPSSVLQAQMNKKKLYVFNTAASLLQIILMAVFIYFYGLTGAVLARVLTRFFILFFLTFLAKRI